MNVDLVPIDSITPYARNPRRNNEQAVDKVAASIHEFGWRVPIVVDEANVIVCGHTRHLAARKLGLEYIAVHRAIGLTPAQIKAYRLMDNRSHQDSNWDEELLGLELEDLKGLDYDLSLTGFEVEELGDYLGQEHEDTPTEQADFIPEPPAESVTRLGDVWVLGAHRIVCGDVRARETWTKLLASDHQTPKVCERVQMCITSPPYWGLRDYGTAQWEGGEAGCSHVELRGTTRGGVHSTMPANAANIGRVRQFKHACPKCGARRIDAQLGLEATPEEWTANLVEVFRRVRECLADDGTCWINLGSSYVSADISPSRPRIDAPAYGNDGKGPQDSPAPDYAYLGLCDECLTGYQNHCLSNAGSAPLPVQSSPPHAPKARDNENQDSVSVTALSELSAVPASTTLESWLRLRGECSRCANRVSVLSVFDVDTHAVRGSAHKRASTPGRTQQLGSSAGRISGKAPSSMAWEHYTSTLKPKDMLPQPWLLALSLQADGWWLRQDIIWAKPNPMPESVTDRCTKAHEYLFLLAKNERYYWDAEAVREHVGEPTRRGNHFRDVLYQEGKSHDNSQSRDGQETYHDVEPSLAGRNRRSVWNIATQPTPAAHFATYPCKLIEPAILAGTSERGHCPACGRGWVRVTEVRPEYQDVLDSGKAWRDDKGKPDGFINRQIKGHVSQVPQKNKTTGWRPACECANGVETPSFHERIPALILDPFLGAGTTTVVAEQTGRACCGIELNPAYCDIAIRRFQRLFDVPATLEGDGRTFDAVAVERVGTSVPPTPQLPGKPRPELDGCTSWSTRDATPRARP